MADLIDDSKLLEQYQRAVEAANKASATEPQAISAHYNGINRLIVIRLNSGAIFSFPPDIAQGLAGATPEDLAVIEITPLGWGCIRKISIRILLCRDSSVDALEQSLR